MILLTVDANDLSFPIATVVAICIGVFTFAGVFFKMQYDKGKLQDRIKLLEDVHEESEMACLTRLSKMEEHHKQEIVGLRNSKRNLKKDLMELLKDKERVIMSRIDKLQLEAKEDRLANNKEFKIIAGELKSIAGGIGELKGMIQNGKS